MGKTQFLHAEFAKLLSVAVALAFRRNPCYKTKFALLCGKMLDASLMTRAELLVWCVSCGLRGTKCTSYKRNMNRRMTVMGAVDTEATVIVQQHDHYRHHHRHHHPHHHHCYHHEKTHDMMLGDVSLMEAQYKPLSSSSSPSSLSSLLRTFSCRLIVTSEAPLLQFYLTETDPSAGKELCCADRVAA